MGEFKVGVKIIKPKNINAFVGGMRVNLKTAEKELPHEFALHAERKVKSTIYKQNFTVPPLTPTYMKWKTEHGLDDRILVATGEYVRAIKVKSLKGVWFVVVPREEHSNSNLMMDDIAGILEFGSPARNIPARPVWAESVAMLVAEYPSWAKKFIKKLLSASFGVELKGTKWVEVEMGEGAVNG